MRTDTEVDQFYRPLFCEEDVVAFDVSVHTLVLVEVHQSLRQNEQYGKCWIDASPCIYVGLMLLLASQPNLTVPEMLTQNLLTVLVITLNTSIFAAVQISCNRL